MFSHSPRIVAYLQVVRSAGTVEASDVHSLLDDDRVNLRALSHSALGHFNHGTRGREAGHTEDDVDNVGQVLGDRVGHGRAQQKSLSLAVNVLEVADLDLEHLGGEVRSGCGAIKCFRLKTAMKPYY